MYYSKSSISRVECHVTIKRNRIKKYKDSFFLKSGQEFELELFNPHTESALVKISFGGEEISLGGIILRPGERVYLERYLESERKFKFETYEIDGSEESKKAIRLNGLVKVTTYFKTKPNNTSYLGNYRINGIYTDLYRTPSFYDNQINYNTNTNISSTGNDLKSFLTNSLESYYSSNDNLQETGIISKGGKSDQKFQISNENFSSFSSEQMSFRILPESQKPVEGADIRKYCTSCGTRVKSAGWKFCPSCGKEVE
jgi:hypothetical protein